MSSVPYFRVQFMKDHVISNEGRSNSVLQRVVDIEARDKQEALQKAQQTFAVLENICDWHVHADRVEVTGVRKTRPEITDAQSAKAVW